MPLISKKELLGLQEIASAVRRYKKENENPAPDYGYRRFLRDELFGILDKAQGG